MGFKEFYQKLIRSSNTLDTICDPNIMTLAQAGLEIFCSQASIGLYEREKKQEREIIQSWI